MVPLRAGADGFERGREAHLRQREMPMRFLMNSDVC